jgi:hypothetical protein
VLLVVDIGRCVQSRIQECESKILVEGVVMEMTNGVLKIFNFLTRHRICLSF